MSRKLLSSILLFLSMLLAACNGAAPITTGVDTTPTCTDSSSCIDTAKPICKDAGDGKKTCQEASTQAECDALVPADNKTCVKYTLDGGKCTKTEGPSMTSDSCCPQTTPMTYSDTDVDCPAAPDECQDSSTCSGDTPICKPDTHGTKKCQAASTQGECDALVPADNKTCVKYTLDSGKCTKTEGASMTSDSCCPEGNYSDTDVDCPVKCTVASVTTDCQDPMKPVCKDDGNGQLTCQAASTQAECDALVPADNKTCVKYTLDGGKCTKTEGASMTSDSCCPEGNYSDTDVDCPVKCTVASVTTDCQDPMKPVCKDDGKGQLTCQAASSQKDCEAVYPHTGCDTVEWDSAQSKCVQGQKSDDPVKSDGCCLTGHYKDADVDCPAAPDECQDSSTCSGATPICKPDTYGTKKCQAASSQAECEAIYPHTGCDTVEWDSAQSKCVQGQKSDNPVKSDGCCLTGHYKDADVDCPAAPDECQDSTTCSGATPICKPDTYGTKKCQPASNQKECNALVPADNKTCVKYTLDGGKCTKTEGASMTSDSCCPEGNYSDNDVDCPVKCTVASVTTDCTDPMKPVCKADGKGQLTCQAATDYSECVDQLVPKDNSQCVTYTLGTNGECVSTKLTMGNTSKKDGCCPDPKMMTSTVDLDCPIDCSNSPRQCTEDFPVCKRVGTHQLCQKATSTQECIDALVPKDNTTCLTYTLGTDGTCKQGTLTTASGATQDGCCPDSAHLTNKDDADCPLIECKTSNDCTDISKPICDTDLTLNKKVCREAKTQDECNALVPTDNVNCEAYKLEDGRCDATPVTPDPSLQDKCCPDPAHLTNKDDADCPQVTTCKNSDDCKMVASRPVCKDDGHGTHICQAPENIQDCQSFMTASNACKNIIWDGHACTEVNKPLSGKTSDGCCLNDKTLRKDKDIDCPAVDDAYCKSRHIATDQCKEWVANAAGDGCEETQIASCVKTTEVGDPCTDNSSCGTGTGAWTCLMGANYPGGYCSKSGYSCPAGSDFADTSSDFSAKFGDNSAYCLKKCPTGQDSECGRGSDYVCVDDYLGDKYCVSKVVIDSLSQKDKPFGEKCSKNEECTSGLCDGFCTTTCSKTDDPVCAAGGSDFSCDMSGTAPHMCRKQCKPGLFADILCKPFKMTCDLATLYCKK